MGVNCGRKTKNAEVAVRNGNKFRERTREEHQHQCDSACSSPNVPGRRTKCLLVRAEEEVVGRVRHQRLLADVCGDGAAGSWSGAPVGV
jgi:hypothetical protein